MRVKFGRLISLTIADFASMWFMNCQNSLGYVYLCADADVLGRMGKAVN